VVCVLVVVVVVVVERVGEPHSCTTCCKTRAARGDRTSVSSMYWACPEVEDANPPPPHTHTHAWHAHLWVSAEPRQADQATHAAAHQVGGPRALQHPAPRRTQHTAAAAANGKRQLSRRTTAASLLSPPAHMWHDSRTTRLQLPSPCPWGTCTLIPALPEPHL
jgi:hypothetical protein